MIPAVQDAWSLVAKPGNSKLPLISPDQLKQELEGIKNQRAMVILLVDLLDASGSFVGKVREMSGKNPVVLIGTKVKFLLLCSLLQD